MTKVSIQKMSILGLVLMGASAVTAWVLPKEKPAFRASGALAASAGALGGQQTCKAGSANTCDFTATDDAASWTSNIAAEEITSAAGASTVALTNTGLLTHNDNFKVTQ